MVYHVEASLNTFIRGIWLDQYASGARFVPTPDVLLYAVIPAIGIAFPVIGVVAPVFVLGVCLFALQFRVFHPFTPPHDHFHGQLPDTTEVVPEVQRF